MNFYRIIIFTIKVWTSGHSKQMSGGHHVQTQLMTNAKTTSRALLDPILLVSLEPFKKWGFGLITHNSLEKQLLSSGCRGLLHEIGVQPKLLRDNTATYLAKFLYQFPFYRFVLSHWDFAQRRRSLLEPCCSRDYNTTYRGSMMHKTNTTYYHHADGFA